MELSKGDSMKDLKIKAKNIIVSGKIFLTLALCGTVGIGLTGCGSEEVPAIEESLATSIENNKEDTYFDEVLATESNTEKEYQETIYNLEDTLKIVTKLETIKYDQSLKFNDLSEETQEELMSLSNDEIIALIEEYEQGGKNFVEESRLLQKLVFLKEYSREQIAENGLSVAEEMLKMVIKSRACEVSGLEAENYEDCSIAPQPSKYADPENLKITVTDKVSGLNKTYSIDENSIYGDIVYEIYSIQQNKGEELSYEEVIDHIENALNLTKVSLYSGVVLNEDEIDSKYNYSEVKEKVKTPKEG